MKLYRKRAIKKEEKSVEPQTATEVRIPLLLRISQHCDGTSWCGLLCVAGSAVGGRMGQKQTLAPMIDSGSCDRQSWRIMKMKLATGETAAKSKTKGFVLYSSSNTLVCVEGEDCVWWCCGKGGEVAPSQTIPVKL